MPKSTNAVSRIFTVLLGVSVAVSGCKGRDDSKQPKEEPCPKDGIELVELDLELDAITSATPPRGSLEDISPPHLRKTKKREPFMVVQGLENLALFKPVTVSEKPITGEIEQITDGIKTSEGFDFVEGPGWIQVDLEEPASIHAIVVWHFYKSPVIYDDIIVRVSDDANFSQNVRTLFNNDHDNSAGMGTGSDTAYLSVGWGEIVDARDVDLTPVTARFIRVYTGKSTDGLSPRYVEIAVYGKPGPGVHEK